MENLQWILLLLGVTLIGAIYFLGRSRSKIKQSLLDAARDVDIAEDSVASADSTSDEAPIGEIADQLQELNALLVDSSGGRGQTADPLESLAAPAEEKIIALHVAAPRDQYFRGEDLVDIFARRGYQFGQHDIYHSIHEGRTVFSIVNLVKPGWFNPESMAEFTTPGISLFLQLPGPLAPNVALDVLLAEARALADELGGVIEDEQHSTFTRQTEQHLHEQVRDYMHRDTTPRDRS